MWPDKTQVRESLTSDTIDLCFGKVITARKDRPGLAKKSPNIQFKHLNTVN